MRRDASCRLPVWGSRQPPAAAAPGSRLGPSVLGRRAAAPPQRVGWVLLPRPLIAQARRGHDSPFVDLHGFGSKSRPIWPFSPPSPGGRALIGRSLGPAANQHAPAAPPVATSASINRPITAAQPDPPALPAAHNAHFTPESARFSPVRRAGGGVGRGGARRALQ